MAHQETPTTTLNTNGGLSTRPVSAGDLGSPRSAVASPGAGQLTTDRDGNTAGRATAMTLLTRIQGWGGPYLRLVMWALRHLHPLTQARNLSFIHFAHFSVLNGLAPGPAAKGTRSDPYLLFESNFNGPWEEYIEAFCQVIRLDISVLMACSEGFPGLVPARGFRTFMQNHEFVAEHYYSAYPQASASLIRAAQELRGDLARLSKAATRHDDKAFAHTWSQTLADPRVQANLGGQGRTHPSLLAYLRRMLVAKKNVADNAYAFLALTPVPAERVGHLRSHLQRLPRGPKSPLAGVPGTHFGRWVVIDRVFHDSWPEQFEQLDPAFLLFTAVFDRKQGDAVGTYLDALLSALGSESDAIWGTCQGWPSTDDRQARVSYLRAHQCDAQFLFGGYPGEVAEIRRALEDRERLVDLVRQAQTLPPDELRSAFTAAFTPDPGTATARAGRRGGDR